ncbi:hypothetical protein H4W81_002313 [Nonomuraea africana]|uniref:Uncharacterized protein n=1 Tax=Nonomuraea africana TaxID=46171 RepID=A0ABR9KBZ1_9ACTN|nr:hypothetical protein [Nonomuraea africana]
MRRPDDLRLVESNVQFTRRFTIIVKDTGVA